eukprot:1150673-Pelagomonas_calceolata.AAC.5
MSAAHACVLRGPRGNEADTQDCAEKRTRLVESTNCLQTKQARVQMGVEHACCVGNEGKRQPTSRIPASVKACPLTREHGGATRQDDVVVQILPDVDIALHDRVEGGVVDAHCLHAHHAGVVQHLRAAEALVADGDGLHAYTL